VALLYETSDHIATITINRPDALNSIDLETWHELSEACAKLEADDDIWVGIITGAGGRSFSAGADLKETIPTLIDDPRGNRYDEPDTIMRGQTVTKPLIAAVNGLALGGGEARATYLRGSGSEALVFRYTLPETGGGHDSVEVTGDSLRLDGGSIASTGGGLAAVLSHPGVVKRGKLTPYWG